MSRVVKIEKELKHLLRGIGQDSWGVLEALELMKLIITIDSEF